MVSCKAIISKTARNNFSILLKYADKEFPEHQTVFKACLKVQECAAYLLRKSIVGSGSRTLICYDFNMEHFVEPAFITEETQHVAYTGAVDISDTEVIWCLSRILCGITADKIEGELIVEAEGKVIETWHCPPNMHAYEINDSRKLDKLFKYMEQM